MKRPPRTGGGGGGGGGRSAAPAAGNPLAAMHAVHQVHDAVARLHLGHPYPNPSNSPAKSPKVKKQTGELSASEKIGRLPCSAEHTPTTYLCELISQLIGARRLRAVGPAQPGSQKAVRTQPTHLQCWKLTAHS